MLGIGIIGSGFIASQHAMSSQGLKGAQMRAVTGSDASQLAEFAARFSLKAYDTLEEMLRDDSIDAVLIGTPTDTHPELALKAIAAGKHVFIEKPMALTVADAERVAHAADDAGVVLAVGHVIRYFPDYRVIAEALERGDIGNPAVATLGRRCQLPEWSSENWLLDQQRSGGVLLDMLIHDIDLVRWYFGEPDRVYTRQMKNGSGLDYVLATLHVPEGPICHLHASWCEPDGFSHEAEICGSEGMLHYDLRDQGEFLYARHDGQAEGASALPPPRMGPDDAFLLQQQAFVDEISGKGTLINDAAWAIGTLQVVEAMIESVSSGNSVRLITSTPAMASVGGAQ